MKPSIICYALLLACTSAMAQETQVALNVDFQGVWSNPNQHSKVPAGAARRAENVVNPRPGVATTLPGQENLAAYTGSDERFSSGAPYQGCFVEHTTDDFAGGAEDSYLYVRDLSTGVLTPQANVGNPDYAVYPPDGAVRIPFVVAGGKLYMATLDGVRVMDGVSSAPATVGVPAPVSAIWGSIGVANVGSGSGVSALSAVACRWTFVRRDSAGVEMESVPSGRIVVDNTNASAADITVDIILPDTVVAGDEIRFFKSGEVATTTDPGDIMSLTSTHVVTSGDVSAKHVSITDTTPPALRGATLYTNATSQSISRQNERPPLARALVGFDESLLLGNVQGPQRMTFRLLAAPDAGDVLTIAGVTYTAKSYSGPTDPDYTNGEFEPTSGSTASQNVYNSALALIDAINRTTANTTVYASYASGESDPPGIIQIEARDIAASAFTAQVSAHGERYEPELTSAHSSQSTTEPNGLWVSKRGDYASFPPLRSSSATYRFRVGVKGNPILAMAPLRDAVIVFVQNEGVWRVKRAGGEGWRVDQINNNAHLLVPGSVAVVDNQALALTTRGLVAVDESGVEEIDLPIKGEIDALKALSLDVLQAYTFAVGDEARLRYTLYHPSSNASSSADHAWIYNADQGTWTERTDPASGGLVGEEDGLLYLGAADSNHLTRERTGTASQVYKRPDNSAIPVRIDWTVMDEGDPGAMKQFTELRLLTDEAITGDVTFACTNDLGGSESTTGSTSENVNGEPYVRAWVPDGCQRTSRLKVSVRRNVLAEAFEVVGMKALVPGVYDGDMTR